MYIRDYIPKETSLLHGNVQYADTLVRLMMERFIGRKYKIPRQTTDNTYFPMPGTADWYKALFLHLCHYCTIGLYPIDERSFVSTMVIDIDDHTGSYEGDGLFQAQVIPIIAHCGQLGITSEQILVEHSGAGYHLFFRTAIPVPAMYAVDFLLNTKGNPRNEIRPDNPKPPKLGSLIRLPLGIHQQRALTGATGAVSHLCLYAGGELTMVNDARQAISALEHWRPLENDQILAVVSDDPRKIFLSAQVDGVSERLDTIRRNERRACIKKILYHPTVDGFRGNMCYHLGIYLKIILGVRSDDLRAIMHEWADMLTVPPLTHKAVDDTLRNVMKAEFGPGCRTKMNCNICMHYKLGGACEYSRAQGRLPVKSKQAYGKLKHGRSALSKVEYALMEMAHLKGEHPERGGGWVKTTGDELATWAGIAKTTLNNKVAKGRLKGMKILEVLAAQRKVEYETAAGSKFIWFRIIAE